MPLKTATTTVSPIEPGIYVVQLQALEDMEEGGQYGPTIRWVFRLWDYPGGQLVIQQAGDEAGDPYELWQMSSESMTPKSKARRWAEVLLQRELEDGEDVSEDIIGCRAIATIAHSEAGYARIDSGGLSPYRPKPGVVLEGDE